MMRIILGSLQKELKGIQQQANLFDMYGLDTPGTRTAAGRRQDLLDAEEWAQDMIEAYKEPDIDPQLTFDLEV